MIKSSNPPCFDLVVCSAVSYVEVNLLTDVLGEHLPVFIRKMLTWRNNRHMVALLVSVLRRDAIKQSLLGFRRQRDRDVMTGGIVVG